MSDDPHVQTFTPSATMAAFMRSDKYARLLAGPMGGGKSVCCTHTLLEWATLQEPNRQGVRRTRFLIVRNTRDQLMSTTWKTVTEWIPVGENAEWKSIDKTLTVKFQHGDTTVHSEFMFIALDEPADVRKALSLEATGAWLNEWRELHPDVVDGLLGRVNRFPPPRDGVAITRAGVIMDTNMPAEDTWHWSQMEEPPGNWSVHIQPPAILDRTEFVQQEHEDPPDAPLLDSEGNEWWVNPQADNIQFLAKTYYTNLIPGKKPDYIRAFLRSQYARSMSGKPVYEQSFKPAFHIAKTPFKPIASESYPVVVGLDFGRTPAAVFKQKDARGRVITLSEVTSENMGLEKFLSTKLKPHIYEHYQRCSLVIAPDPAGFFKQQLGEVTPVDVLKREGFKVQKPATNDPAKRIECVERLLMLQIDGEAAYLVNPDVTMIVKGFKYGYKFKIRRDGTTEDSPLKNEYSHPHDANQYADLVIEQGATGAFFTTARREVKAVSAAGWT